MRVVKAPPIVFKCDSCGATNEGDAEEFESQNTMPPSWLAECGFCHCKTRCFPSALIARAAGATGQIWADYIRELAVRKVMES